MYLTKIVEALWFILPAYFANSTPLNVSKIKFLRKYGTPIDGGRTFQGVRIFGDGKTWRGFFSGIIAGSLIGLVQMSIRQESATFLQGFFNEPLSLPHMSLELAFMLSLGTIIGDMAASFVKRRVGLAPGDPAPLLDQLNFVFGAFFFAWLLTGSINENYFLILIIITPLVHISGNFIAWLWNLKKEPW